MDSPHTRQGIRGGDLCEGGGFTLSEKAATEDMAATEDDDAGSSMRLRLAISSLVFMS